MIAHNDITGDLLKTKGANDLYREGWDRIFKNAKKALEEGTLTKISNEHQPPVKELRVQPLKLAPSELYLPYNLDQKVLDNRPASLDDRENWWAWCQQHQLSIADIPTFEQWRSAHSQG